MGFWSGFESLTGHQPGAFTGFTLKDILDEDMWKMMDRKFPSPRYAEEGLPAPQTAWYKGMGRPEMMGPRVGAAGMVPVEEDQTILRNRPDIPPMAIGRDRPFPMPRRDAGVTTAAPSTQPQPLKRWPTFDNPYRRPATLMNLPAGGRQRVPSLYDPYLSGLRSDQMGAAGFNPLERRMHQSRVGQQELSTAGQYRKGLQDAVGTLGDAFLPAGVMEKGREIWGDLRDYYYPEEDKTTVVTESADPNIPTQRKTTIKGKVRDRDDELRRMMYQYRGY